MPNKNRAIKATDVAAWFINRIDRDSGESITHLKLQKLVYYAEAWYLANFDRSLINEDMEAWAHGPVSPSVWAKYKENRWNALDREEVSNPIPKDIEQFLEAVFEKYSQYSAKYLEESTHNEEPWKIARDGCLPGESCSNIIDKLTIRNYYASQLGKEKISRLAA